MNKLRISNCKIYFLSATLFAAVFFGLSPKAFALDDSYLKGRAIQIANFTVDDLVVTPKLIYNSPGNKVAQQDLISPTRKVVDLIDPKYSLFGITAVFESPKYEIQDSKRNYFVFSFKRRVGDILAAGGVELANEDIVSPSRDTLEPAQANIIKITRVSLANIEEFESVPYRTKKTEDPTLDKGKQVVKQYGKSGKKQLTYQVRREDGVEVSRKLVSEEIVTEPQTELIVIGTKPVITVRCRYNDTVATAAAKYGIDPDTICNLMMKESNGHADSINPDGYYGLFQYSLSFWSDASSRAGYSDASWSDPTAQIYTTAWALTHGYSGRW